MKHSGSPVVLGIVDAREREVKGAKGIQGSRDRGIEKGAGGRNRSRGAGRRSVLGR